MCLGRRHFCILLLYLLSSPFLTSLPQSFSFFDRRSRKLAGGGSCDTRRASLNHHLSSEGRKWGLLLRVCSGANFSVRIRFLEPFLTRPTLPLLGADSPNPLAVVQHRRLRVSQEPPPPQKLRDLPVIKIKKDWGSIPSPFLHDRKKK